MVTFLPDRHFSIYGPKTNFLPKIDGHLGFSACSPLYPNENPNKCYFLISYDILHQEKLSSSISEKTALYSPLLTKGSCASGWATFNKSHISRYLVYSVNFFINGWYTQLPSLLMGGNFIELRSVISIGFISLLPCQVWFSSSECLFMDNIQGRTLLDFQVWRVLGPGLANFQL